LNRVTPSTLPQPTRLLVNQSPWGPKSGGNCLFLAYDSWRMRVGPCGAGGGRREEEEKLEGLEGQGGPSPAQARFQPCDRLLQRGPKSSPFLAHPSSGPNWTPISVFPFSSSLRALETHGLSVPLSTHTLPLCPMGSHTQP
jgi:hypothetical protein